MEAALALSSISFRPRDYLNGKVDQFMLPKPIQRDV
jgi:hypothetical protein